MYLKRMCMCVCDVYSELFNYGHTYIDMRLKIKPASNFKCLVLFIDAVVIPLTFGQYTKTQFQHTRVHQELLYLKTKGWSVTQRPGRRLRLATKI